MICLIFFAICFLASAAGAICGIGGGVIIKPVLDAFGILDVNVISFLSGCTVLSMTTYSVVKSRMSRESHVETAVGIPLALGAAAGGLFSQLASLASSIVTGSVPKFQTGVLLLMVSGGIAGGICGRACNKRMEERTVNRLFVGLMILMILINLYNMIQFMR